MRNPNIPIGDALFATLFTSVSRGLKHTPNLDRRITGPNTVPAGWHFPSNIVATDIDNWVTFDGEPTSTRLPIPTRYRAVGVLMVSKSEIEVVATEVEKPRHAVAVRFGEALVIGALSENKGFAVDTDDSDTRLVGLRIGRGDVTAAAGVWDDDGQQFHSVPADLWSITVGRLPDIPVV
jgi:hypothetical protein